METLRPRCFERGDVQHLHCGWYTRQLLHVHPLPAMRYSHLTVKERAAPLVDDDRIQNVFSCGRFPLHAHTELLLYTLHCCFYAGSLCWHLGCFVIFRGALTSTTRHLHFLEKDLNGPFISANIDSFAASANCLHWDADAFMLQEARIAESNMVESQRKAALCNFHLYCSQPLQKLHGAFRIPSGGTATCAHKEFTQLFDETTDLSGTWQLLRSTARITATWHQVSSSVKLLLAFNFYAIANAASERAKFERNNDLLDMIFTVASQFGDIPILIAGGFQMEPGMYPSVQPALDHWGWADPLLQTDDQGDVFWPCTFFRHSASEEGDGQSSIDGILVNRTALTALMHVEVLDHQDRQHRPVRATFAWDRVQQVGTDCSGLLS